MMQLLVVNISDVQNCKTRTQPVTQDYCGDTLVIIDAFFCNFVTSGLVVHHHVGAVRVLSLLHR